MATTTSISLSEVTRIYWDDIWKIHSIPKKIIIDREPQFVSTFIGKLQSIRNQKSNVNGLSSTNRWSNGKDQPRSQSVSKILY